MNILLIDNEIKKKPFATFFVTKNKQLRSGLKLLRFQFNRIIEHVKFLLIEALQLSTNAK
jgi:hypothetical protein